MIYTSALEAIRVSAALTRETGLTFLGHKMGPGRYIVAQVHTN